MIFSPTGQGAIHLAAMAGHCNVIRALFHLGADINMTVIFLHYLI